MKSFGCFGQNNIFVNQKKNIDFECMGPPGAPSVERGHLSFRASKKGAGGKLLVGEKLS